MDLEEAAMVEHSNRFLDSLLPGSRTLLLKASTRVSLPLKTALIAPGIVPRYAYFLTSGIVSYVAVMSDGWAAEVEVVGREGVVGALSLLGPAPYPTHAMMQLQGEGYRIPFDFLNRAFCDSVEIRGRVLEFVQASALTTLQIAGCHALHEVESRLSRWLLMVSDRTGLDTLQFTHEFLAQMMGTRRTTLTAVAGSLQRRGLVEYSRGRVTILDRSGLEQAACSCYAISKLLMQGLYTQQALARQ